MAGPLPIGDPAPADGALPNALIVDPAIDFGVYLHVPFCRVRCGYCDFNTYTATELHGARQDQYADTLLREIELSVGVLARAGAPRREASTVFFGGGTPTLLPAGDLGRMLAGVRDA
ncbi:MAG: coproporphyrinogen III oxidase, partial [Microbacteriaceae bacterium]|nr:coproporphyrinogen III oxidase [Microbacteriaceae bacterium]